MFQINKRDHPLVTILALRGELDQAAAKDLIVYLENLPKAHTPLLFECTRLIKVAYAALPQLQKPIIEQLQIRKVAFCGLAPALKLPIQSAPFGKVIIFDTQDKAVETLSA